MQMRPHVDSAVRPASPAPPGMASPLPSPLKPPQPSKRPLLPLVLRLRARPRALPQALLLVPLLLLQARLRVRLWQRAMWTRWRALQRFLPPACRRHPPPGLASPVLVPRAAVAAAAALRA